jgi:hypothetical protein
MHNIGNREIHIRVVHRESVQLAGHVHVPGLEQIPEFEQTGEHTAEQRKTLFSFILVQIF